MPRDWRPSFAGSWYPADPAELQRLIDQYLASPALVTGATDSSQNTDPSGPVVLVLPHAGLVYSARGQMAAWRRITPEQARSIDLVLVIAPTHYEYIPDGVVVGARFERYRTLPSPFPGVPTLVGSSESHATVAREHAVELMLPLASMRLGTLRETGLPSLAAVVLGNVASAESAAVIAHRIAADIATIADPARTLILVSSDFTHYGPRFGYEPFGTAANETTLAAVRRADLTIAETAAQRSLDRYWELITEREVTICGRFAIAVALALLKEIDPEKHSRGHVLDYYTSLETKGRSTRERDVVCYATIGFGVGDG